MIRQRDDWGAILAPRPRAIGVIQTYFSTRKSRTNSRGVTLHRPLNLNILASGLATKIQPLFDFPI